MTVNYGGGGPGDADSSLALENNTNSTVLLFKFHSISL